MGSGRATISSRARLAALRGLQQLPGPVARAGVVVSAYQYLAVDKRQPHVQVLDEWWWCRAGESVGGDGCGDAL